MNTYITPYHIPRLNVISLCREVVLLSGGVNISLGTTSLQSVLGTGSVLFIELHQFHNPFNALSGRPTRNVLVYGKSVASWIHSRHASQ